LAEIIPRGIRFPPAARRVRCVLVFGISAIPGGHKKMLARN
jgi:hypothetical protein